MAGSPRGCGEIKRTSNAQHSLFALTASIHPPTARGCAGEFTIVSIEHAPALDKAGDMRHFRKPLVSKAVASHFRRNPML
jgi:hypothetical protein